MAFPCKTVLNVIQIVGQLVLSVKLKEKSQAVLDENITVKSTILLLI